MKSIFIEGIIHLVRAQNFLKIQHYLLVRARLYPYRRIRNVRFRKILRMHYADDS